MKVDIALPPPPDTIVMVTNKFLDLTQSLGHRLFREAKFEPTGCNPETGHKITFWPENEKPSGHLNFGTTVSFKIPKTGEFIHHQDKAIDCTRIFS